MDTLTLISAFASITGAGVSIWQARKAKTAAQEVKAARAQMIDHRKTSELAELQTFCQKAQKSMEKFGHGASSVSLNGIDPSREGKDVQDFLLKLNEYRSHFGSKDPNPADIFIKKVGPVLTKFASSSRSQKQMIVLGTEILMEISNMSSIIKKTLDSKRETVH